MLGYIVTFFVIAIVFLIMIRVSIGLDVDSRKNALWVALAFGILNAALQPLMGILPIPNTLIMFFLLVVAANAIVLYLVSALFKGFRINGCVNALIAAIVLGIVNTILYGIWAFTGV